MNFSCINDAKTLLTMHDTSNIVLDCGGITYDPDSDMYTLRQGETPISGASNEISWTRCTVGKIRSR